MPVVVLRRAGAPPRNGSSRLSALLLTLLATALVVSGCQTGAGNSPINPANRPTIIAGNTNGHLPASQLYVVNGSCTLYQPVAGSFNAMVAAARKDGVYLTAAECYRNYAGQVYWKAWWTKHGYPANAATPGYSNHGWGKAADLRDQRGSLTWTSAGYRWLVAHAGAYGWNHPGGVNEAWHWEWVGDGGTMHGYAVRADLMTWVR